MEKQITTASEALTVLSHILMYLDTVMNLSHLDNDELDGNRKAYAIVMECQKIAVATIRLNELTGRVEFK